MFKNDLMETYFWITVRCSDTIEEISFDKDFLLSKETINGYFSPKMCFI